MTAKKSADKPQAEWLNQTQMCRSLGVSVQAFGRWDVKPVARIGRTAYYTVRDVLDNRLAHQAQELEREIDPDLEQMDYERLRLTRAQADGQEIKNDIARGKIAPIEIIRVVLSRIAGEAAGELDSVPLNIRRKNPELDNMVIEEIKRHCVKAQNAIARCDEVLDDVIDDYIAESETV